MNWDPSVIKFTDAENYEYDKWLEQFGRWTGTEEHVVQTTTFKNLSGAEHVVHNMICKALTDANKNFLFHSSLFSNK